MSSTDQLSSSKKNQNNSPSNIYSKLVPKVLVFRVLVVICLLGATCLCSVYAYFVLANAETDSFKDQFQSVAAQILSAGQTRLYRLETSVDELSTMVGLYHPNATTWPMAYVRGYEKLYTLVVKSADLHDITTLPIVKPEEVENFEKYVVEAYENDPFLPPYIRPRSFDVGIITTGPNGVYHDTTGESPYSNISLITPILNIGNITANSGFIMWNVFASTIDTGAAIEASYKCALEFHVPCAALGDIAERIPSRPGNPITSLVSAIYPLYNPEELVGFLLATISWNELFTLLVPDNVCGVDIVVSTGGKSFTWSVCNGITSFSCEGDCHDEDFDSFEESSIFQLRRCVSEVLYQYRVSIYPSQTFYNDYHTDTPWITAVLIIVIFLFTIIVFAWYDFFVKKESQERQQVLEAKRRFVRFVSHEIRTPLNTLTLGLDLLYDHIGEEEFVKDISKKQLQELTNDLKGSCEVAVMVLNDLLHYDKIETGSLKLEIESIPIWALIRKTVNLFRGPAKEAQVKLIVENVEFKHLSKKLQCLGIEGDRLRLSQVIGNIISNALKFSPKGSNVIVKTFYSADSLFPKYLLSNYQQTKENPDGWAIFSVSDSGPGISEENLKLLFGEGVQFNPNKLQSGQGSGLGLWISKAIIELHGGSIWAFSEGKGKGCQFFFQLPLVEIPEEIQEIQEDDENDLTVALTDACTRGETSKEISMYKKECCRNMDLSKSQSNDIKEISVEEKEIEIPAKSVAHTILVVDDVPMCRKMLIRTLKAKGYECVEAEDGRDCIDKLMAENKYFCILMDFQMPKLNGPDATRELRRLGFELPIVGVTGNVMTEDIREFMAAGADLVLGKPFSMSDFEEFSQKFK